MTVHAHALADELADIRARIRSLKTREDKLRQQMLDTPALRRGIGFEAVVKPQTRRIFLRDRLPAHILQNPDLWESRIAHVVTLQKRGPVQTRPARPGDPGLAEPEPDFDVIERFA